MCNITATKKAGNPLIASRAAASSCRPNRYENSVRKEISGTIVRLQRVLVVSGSRRQRSTTSSGEACERNRVCVQRKRRRQAAEEACTSSRREACVQQKRRAQGAEENCTSGGSGVRGAEELCASSLHRPEYEATDDGVCPRATEWVPAPNTTSRRATFKCPSCTAR
jgi:hypothetical protein